MAKSATKTKKVVNKVVDPSKAKKSEPVLKIIDATKGSDNKEAVKMKEDRLNRLNDYIMTIRKHSEDMGRSYWEIGHALNRIKFEKLYYAWGSDTLKDLIKDKFKFTYQTARNMMLVAESVDREKAKQLGPMLSLAVAKASDNGCLDEVNKMITEKVSARKVLAVAKAGGSERVPRPPVLRMKKDGPTKVVKVSKSVTENTSMGNDSGEYEIPKPKWYGQKGEVDLIKTDKKTQWKARICLDDGPVINLVLDYRKKIITFTAK